MEWGRYSGMWRLEHCSEVTWNVRYLLMAIFLEIRNAYTEVQQTAWNTIGDDSYCFVEKHQTDVIKKGDKIEHLLTQLLLQLNAHFYY
jgi:hypothetical protein